MLRLALVALLVFGVPVTAQQKADPADSFEMDASGPAAPGSAIVVGQLKLNPQRYEGKVVTIEPAWPGDSIYRTKSGTIFMALLGTGTDDDPGAESVYRGNVLFVLSSDLAEKSHLSKSDAWGDGARVTCLVFRRIVDGQEKWIAAITRIESLKPINGEIVSLAGPIPDVGKGTNPNDALMVTYEVAGPNGQTADITYNSKDGGSVSLDSVRLPWSVSFSVEPGYFAYVSAQLDKSTGTINVKIARQFVAVKTGTSSGKYASASARATIE